MRCISYLLLNGTSTTLLPYSRMPGAPSIDLMRSLVTMTPCYEEDVLYPLDARETGQKLGLKVSSEQVRLGESRWDHECSHSN